MKFLTIIFSVYMLALSCFPCADGNECDVTTKTSITADNDHSRHSHDTESCAPFCSCSCCATSVIYHQVAVYKIPKKVFTPTYFISPDTRYASGVSFSIWQPPKVSV